MPADTPAQSTPQVLEEGNLYFIYCPKVQRETVNSLDDIQRVYLVMGPHGRQWFRLITLGKKRLPDLSGDNQQGWAFVETVTDSAQALEAGLRREEYETKTRGDRIKELFEQALDNPKVNVKTQALKAEDASVPPAMVLIPEAMRRLRDMTAMMQQQTAQFPDEHVLMVNTAHPLVENVLEMSQGAIITGSGESPSAQMAKMICRHVYDLALMAQKGFSADDMNAFVERSNQVLTKLTQD